MSLWSPEAKKAPSVKALCNEDLSLMSTSYLFTTKLRRTEKSHDVADSVSASSAQPLVRTTDSASSALLILFRDKPVVVDELKELGFNIELRGKAFRLGGAAQMYCHVLSQKKALLVSTRSSPSAMNLEKMNSRTEDHDGRRGGEPVANAM
ncbi:hypothetical protein F5141DRAFT_1067891 [Pisolithus sp. B1]|nr:hypothetical protein F5141DRAFT_1067891 [Pisolithus sp. B1]